MFQVQARAQCDKNVTCPSLVLCIYEALWDPAWQKLLYWMGQIAACLTDLICLIEQRDAFGFTSPSKAADSASVKKRGRGEKGKGKEKHPRDISTATGDHLHTLERLPGALFISFKLLIHCCSARALSGHWLPTMAASLENLSTVAVIDQEQNSADDWSPLMPAVGTCLALTTQLIQFSLRIQSMPV